MKKITAGKIVPTEYDVLNDVNFTSKEKWSMILYHNEEVSQDELIEMFVAYLGHTPHQAEQCAILLEAKNKFSVKNDTFENLIDMQEPFVDRGFSVVLETI